MIANPNEPIRPGDPVDVNGHPGKVTATGRGRDIRRVVVELDTPVDRGVENRPTATPVENRPEATT